MSNQQPIPLIRYLYDALDRLVGHNRLNSVGRQCFYCENRLVTETQGEEYISIVQQEGQLLAQQQHRGGRVSSTLLATDLSRSVLSVLDADLHRAIAYTAYGHHPFEEGMTNVLGFNGQRPDPMTGHYLLGNGYRAFSPVLMRFIGPDYLSPFEKGGLNTYAYCAGDPVNRIDPTGHSFSVLATVASKIKARYLSFIYGDYVKPVKNLTRISEELAVFVDEYKGGSRLNIFGHGTSSGGVLREKGTFLGPKSLSEYIKNSGLQFESFDSARLLTCHSGSEFIHSLNPSSAPFGQLFSDFSGLPVKAYKGRFLGGGVTSRIEKLKVGETSTRTAYFSITKRPESLRSKFLGASYDPVSFQPSKLIRDVRAE